jgi:hypothetical protein
VSPTTNALAAKPAAGRLRGPVTLVRERVGGWAGVAVAPTWCQVRRIASATTKKPAATAIMPVLEPVNVSPK